MRDPRSSGPYKRARARYIAAHAPGTPCALCGLPVDTTLSGMSAWGPTVEHRLKVSDMQDRAMSWPELIEMACDTRMWGLAHLSCQRKQGAQVGNRRRRPKQARASRDW